MANGYHVRSAVSGRDGLESIEKDRPDIVFLDMLMPGMDGIETLRVIRKKYYDLPVIMVTAYATDEKMREAARMGISGVFPKGADLLEAARLISAALGEIRKDIKK